MIRFRFLKDEQRYVRLVSEVYREIASNLTPRLVSRVLRNFAKVEQLVFLEGVRQGLAIAEISNLSEQVSGPITVRSNKPFQAHALVYGSSDTPLTDTERRWLARLGAREDHAEDSWLEGHPMRFAPQTLEEALQEEPQEPQAAHGGEGGGEGPSSGESAPWAAEEVEGARPLTEDDIRRIIDGDCSDTETKPEPRPESDGEGPDTESPAFLDRVRDRIQGLQKGGREFSSWQDLILALHVDMATDAAFLDLQLTTDMGRAVLDQCGLYNLHPGASIDLSASDDQSSGDRSSRNSDG